MTRILLGILVVIALFAVVQFGNNRINISSTKTQESVTTSNTISGVSWETYESNDLGFTFQYPETLDLKVVDGEVVLNHNIPYKNYGDCDMTVSEESETLDDFNLAFFISEEVEIPDYSTSIQIGERLGKVAYGVDGAEGCGNTYYYFETPGNRTLVIKRADIQILSGIRGNSEEIDEILKISDAISKEENDKIFQRIVSSLELVSR